MLEWKPRLVLMLVVLASLASVLSAAHVVTGLINLNW